MGCTLGPPVYGHHRTTTAWLLMKGLEGEVGLAWVQKCVWSGEVRDKGLVLMAEVSFAFPATEMRLGFRIYIPACVNRTP